MGFLNINDGSSLSTSTGKLDLIEYEDNLIDKFNDTNILNTKYLAEEFGIYFEKKNKKADVYLYDGTEEITICPEPLTFIKQYDDVSDNMSKAHAQFIEQIKTFQRITLNKIPELNRNSASKKRIWMNKTLTGINLRPGNLNDDRDKFDPIRMCDDNVHGLIAGRTGSGKSVYINALILSLITEYAPWELNLYLADFKKVELSRYMNNSDELNNNIAFTPHVNACAATSEIRYVISLIKYLVDCMNSRQEFFARLGVTKIQEFRNKYNLILPRVLLIVDEFQQLFTEATNREKDEIQIMLNSITKLGRATGFHLIFASQEMSGTLRGNTLANFKIRMALPCNQQISVDILGNSQATDLERGYVLINTDSGNQLSNLKYRVPFIETDKKDSDDDNSKTTFYKFLDEIKLASCLYDLSYKTSTQKFYREELQETENSYKADLDYIMNQKNKLVSANKDLFDAIVLGKTVLYSPKSNDKVSFYIERGRNKGIMIACPESDNAARVRKLLAENLLRSDTQTYHFAFELNSLIFERYRFDKEIINYPIHKYFSCNVDKLIECIGLPYHMRAFALKYIESYSQKIECFKQTENKLRFLLQDNENITEYVKYKQHKQSLKTKLEDIEAKLSIMTKESNKTLSSPIVGFLEKCSKEIVLIPADNTKVDIVNLKLYKDIISEFTININIDVATKNSIDMLDKQINVLSKIEAKNDNDKLQNQLAIKRNKILRRAILFFSDKYDEKIPQKTSISGILESIYQTVSEPVLLYKKACNDKENVLNNINELSNKRTDLKNELLNINSNPHVIETTEKEMLDLINSFIKYVFDSAYTAIGYKKDRPITPEIEYIAEEDGLKWFINANSLDEKIKLVVNDVLNNYIEYCRSGLKYAINYKKIVVWINGFDEIEKLPNQLGDIIRNAINQNILIIAMITSELKDTTIRKAFDYAFITGNIEKFYSMFDLKYTKQPLDSIVVNFSVRSKGLDIPFKMYKSNLEEIQSPNFIDQLLNA